MTRTLAKAAVVLCTSAAIGLSLIGTASAQDHGAPLPGDRAPSVSTTQLAASPSASMKSGHVTTALAVGICTGQTDDPHRSYGFVSVHARTDCPYPVDMIVSINLLRDRWYGWEYEANGYKEAVTSEVNGNAKWYCVGVGTYTYEGSSYHRATVGGQTLIGYTANDARLTC